MTTMPRRRAGAAPRRARRGQPRLRAPLPGRSRRRGSRCTPSTAAPSSTRPRPRARLGELALRSLASYAPDALELARGGRLRADDDRRRARSGGAARAFDARSRPRFAARAPRPGWRSPSTSACAPSCEREPVEDFRIDFEDGFGARPDAEEDATAARRGARGGARAWPRARCRRSSASASSPSARSGKRRGARTLELFLDTLLAATRRPAARQLRRHAAQGHDRRAAARAGAPVRAARGSATACRPGSLRMRADDRDDAGAARRRRPLAAARASSTRARAAAAARTSAPTTSPRRATSPRRTRAWTTRCATSPRA